jgi:hypothetical protein
MSRVLDIAAFLDAHGWGDASHTPMDADFSSRRYARLTHEDGDVAILMDADRDQKTTEFVSVAKALRQIGITAPDIYAAEPMRGLVLMQNLGEQNIGTLLDGGADPVSFYTEAARLLAQLHKHFASTMIADIDLPIFNSKHLAEHVTLFLDTYVQFQQGRDASSDERDDFYAAWVKILQPLDALPQSLMLRDFMPDNMMLLADGSLGVLDFQDAGIGPIAYDLASLCEVVRRDGGDGQFDRVLDIYCAEAKPVISRDDLKHACLILSAQRHTRILGILARQIQKGRVEKRAYLERTKRYLNRLIAAPECDAIRRVTTL